jgi:hypothetical protein
MQENAPSVPSLPVFELLSVCILAVFLWFELIVFLLPDRWREKIGALQFGPAWAAKRRERSRD